jgi:hypothetical protein
MYNTCSSKVEHFENIQESRALDHDEILDLLDTKNELYDLHHDEITKWVQWAKDKWVKEGDANTKYFHTIASHNFKKYIIPRLIVNGIEVRDPSGIKDSLLDFYKDLFGKGGLFGDV